MMTSRSITGTSFLQARAYAAVAAPCSILVIGCAIETLELEPLGSCTGPCRWADSFEGLLGRHPSLPRVRFEVWARH
jgi:hypothetical protein